MKNKIIDIRDVSKNFSVELNRFFKVIDSPEKAYIAGLMASDGGVEKKANKIYINMKDDIDNNILLEKVFNIIKLGRIMHGKHYDKKYKKMRYNVRWYVYSKQMKEDLINIGIVPCKSHEDITPIISNIKHVFLNHFIRGFFDGDGSISVDDPDKVYYPKKPQFSITCNCKEFLQDIKDIICKHTKASPNFNVTTTHECYSLCWKDALSVISIREWIYKDAGELYLERKKVKMFKAIDTKGMKRPQSKYIGVQWDTRNNDWLVRVRNKYAGRICLGNYKDDKLAAFVREEYIILNSIFHIKRNFPDMSLLDIQNEIDLSKKSVCLK